MTHDGSRRVPALTALYALRYAAYILLCALIISPGLIGHRILCSLRGQSGHALRYVASLAAAVSLARGACMRASLARSVRDGLRKGGAGASPFRKAGVGDHISPVPGTGGTPNLIVVFTEGLSENIIHDGRGIMPNAARLERESVSFRNYYNHTFATYMGLSGQLHSGYQQGNFSRNMLPSLQSLLGDAGYRTCFINTEPGDGDR